MSKKSTKSDNPLENPIPEQADTVGEVADEQVNPSTAKITNANNESPSDESPVDIASDTFADDSKAELLEKLVLAQGQIDKLKEDYIRAKADVENIRRRSQNEIISARKYAIDGFAHELLSVADSLDQATRVEIDAPAEGTNAETLIKMKEGLELTLKQFNKVMEKFGVTVVEAAPGVKFNPEIHQAISVLASDKIAPEHILEVMQKGFFLKDRLLRPAMVVIAKHIEE